ncbi:MAG: signal peptidase I [Patescibacteria group bacterium]
MRLSFGRGETRDRKIQEEKRLQRASDVPAFAESPKKFIFELLKIVLIALAVIIPVRYFLFQPFYVRGASMEPSFHDNEYLIIDEITYRFADPQRGEVVVVKNPDRTSEFFIKRIIGLPGETIEVKNGDVVIFNSSKPLGFILEEPYLSEEVVTRGGQRTTLGPDQYFVMGDNRSVSLDSRTFGPLNSSFIVGRAWLRVWPFEEFEHFTPPAYNLNGA